MDPAVEQILLAKILQDSESPTAQQAMLMGALGGGGIGLLGGMAAHPVGRAMAGVADKVVPYHPVTKRDKKGKAIAQSLKARPRNRPLKPGSRMAGGLVGMILGGGLGAAIRDQAIRDSPEAAILAKSQAQGLTEADEYELARLLENTYTSMGLM